MRPMEQNYDFRKKLLQVHKPDLYDRTQEPEAEELVLCDGIVIALPEDAGVVMQTAAKDFADYLLTSMGVSALVKIGEIGSSLSENQRITLSVEGDTGADLGEAKGYSGFQILTGETITLQGYDERGVAQGLYFLEDEMSSRRAPFLKKGTVQRKPAFSPRMIHSGYGLDDFPDAHLSAIAHAGMDTILVFTKGPDETPFGYLDFNTLIYRAARYGIDVYAYSYLSSRKHPDETDAESYYDNLYGTVFKKCPGLKGLVLVGESVEFPSKDPHTSGRLRTENFIDGIPTGKPSPGWWPCFDYPDWLNMVKKIVRKYNPELDVVFWTYNWSTVDKEERLKLIRSLPTDISLLATFEMGEKRQMGSAVSYCSDYTLSFEGPGSYFASEAEEAKKRGIRMYTMANTGGLTWDCGVIPYEPMPYQWMKRYKALLAAKEKWNLCGIMESHHYGLWPSFISDLTKKAFYHPKGSMEDALTEVLQKHFGKEYIPELKKALELWSEAITYIVPSVEHQYGPSRIGPSYPLCLDRSILPPAMPYATTGTGSIFAKYNPRNSGKCSPSSVRMPEELKYLSQMLSLLKQGLAVLEPAAKKNDAIAELADIIKFLCITEQTVINVKEWFLLTTKLQIESDPEQVAQLLADLEALAEAEIANAEAAIPLVQRNSRLGWEPTLEYLTDEWHIRWKIRQVRYVIDTEIGYLKKCRNIEKTWR